MRVDETEVHEVTPESILEIIKAYDKKLMTIHRAWSLYGKLDQKLKTEGTKKQLKNISGLFGHETYEGFQHIMRFIETGKYGQNYYGVLTPERLGQWTEEFQERVPDQVAKLGGDYEELRR